MLRNKRYTSKDEVAGLLLFATQYVRIDKVYDYKLWKDPNSFSWYFEKLSFQMSSNISLNTSLEIGELSLLFLIAHVFNNISKLFG